MIRRELEKIDGIITVIATGQWTAADVTEHFSKLRELISARRDAGLPVRVLSDMSLAQRQSSDIETMILEEIEDTFREGDRVAHLVADQPARVHIRTVLKSVAIPAFCSRIAAEMYLMSDMSPPTDQTELPDRK